MKKYLFIFFGSLSLFLGFLGIFTPGLPTTPFVLLTGYLYARSSPRLYAKLQNNKITGICLRSVDEGLGWRMQLASISLMWIMVLITAFFVFERGSTMRYIMIALGFIGTISQMIALRKKKPKNVLIELASASKNDVSLDTDFIVDKEAEMKNKNKSLVYNLKNN